MSEEAGQYIIGVTEKGKKFRPSDWVDRIASVFGYYDANRRLQYSPFVRPAIFEGLRCLFIASSLLIVDPAGYDFVMDFAKSNHLQIKHVEVSQANEEPQSSSHSLPDVA